MSLAVYACLLGRAMTAARQPRGEGKPETEGTETAVGERSSPAATMATGTGVYELPSEAHYCQCSTPVKRQLRPRPRRDDGRRIAAKYSLKMSGTSTKRRTRGENAFTKSQGSPPKEPPAKQSRKGSPSKTLELTKIGLAC